MKFFDWLKQKDQNEFDTVVLTNSSQPISKKAIVGLVIFAVIAASSGGYWLYKSRYSADTITPGVTADPIGLDNSLAQLKQIVTLNPILCTRNSSGVDQRQVFKIKLYDSLGNPIKKSIPLTIKYKIPMTFTWAANTTTSNPIQDFQIQRLMATDDNGEINLSNFVQDYPKDDSGNYLIKPIYYNPEGAGIITQNFNTAAGSWTAPLAMEQTYWNGTALSNNSGYGNYRWNDFRTDNADTLQLIKAIYADFYPNIPDPGIATLAKNMLNALQPVPSMISTNQMAFYGQSDAAGYNATNNVVTMLKDAKFLPSQEIANLPNPYSLRSTYIDTFPHSGGADNDDTEINPGYYIRSNKTYYGFNLTQLLKDVNYDYTQIGTDTIGKITHYGWGNGVWADSIATALAEAFGGRPDFQMVKQPDNTKIMTDLLASGTADSTQASQWDSANNLPVNHEILHDPLGYFPSQLKNISLGKFVTSMTIAPVSIQYGTYYPVAIDLSNPLSPKVTSSMSSWYTKTGYANEGLVPMTLEPGPAQLVDSNTTFNGALDINDPINQFKNKLLTDDSLKSLTDIIGKFIRGYWGDGKDTSKATLTDYDKQTITKIQNSISSGTGDVKEVDASYDFESATAGAISDVPSTDPSATVGKWLGWAKNGSTSVGSVNIINDSTKCQGSKCIQITKTADDNLNNLNDNSNDAKAYVKLGNLVAGAKYRITLSFRADTTTNVSGNNSVLGKVSVAQRNSSGNNTNVNNFLVLNNAGNNTDAKNWRTISGIINVVDGSSWELWLYNMTKTSPVYYDNIKVEQLK